MGIAKLVQKLCNMNTTNVCENNVLCTVIYNYRLNSLHLLTVTCLFSLHRKIPRKYDVVPGEKYFTPRMVFSEYNLHLYVFLVQVQNFQILPTPPFFLPTPLCSNLKLFTHSTHFFTHSTLSKFETFYPLHPFYYPLQLPGHYPLHLFFYPLPIPTPRWSGFR